jgi:hypothetical protein
VPLQALTEKPAAASNLIDLSDNEDEPETNVRSSKGQDLAHRPKDHAGEGGDPSASTAGLHSVAKHHDEAPGQTSGSMRYMLPRFVDTRRKISQVERDEQNDGLQPPRYVIKSDDSGDGGLNKSRHSH